MVNPKNNLALENTEQTNELMTLSEVAEFLGLDYFHARTLLLNDNSIGCYEYGRKRLWQREDRVAFKEKHFKAPLRKE